MASPPPTGTNSPNTGLVISDNSDDCDDKIRIAALAAANAAIR
jgi:hypothetical protein